MLNRIIFIVFFSLPFFSCKKHHDSPADNPYGLPNATQNGSNIFACLLNGQKFIGFNDPNHIGAAFINDTLVVGGQPKNKNYIENILLQIKTNDLNPNVYNIDNKNAFSSLITDSTCLRIGFTISRFYAINGNIKLTKFDTSKKIVSGIFNCTIPVPNCDTLKITEGRFDIVYH